MSDKQIHITRLKYLVEEKSGLGKYANWKVSHFDKLSEIIFEETKGKVSTSTLKRFYSSGKDSTNPSITTLNILSKYIGYNDWFDFYKKTKVNNIKNVKSVLKRNTKLILIFSALIISAILINLVIQKSDKIDSNDVLLEFNKSEYNYPENIEITYNLKSVKNIKSACIKAISVIKNTDSIDLIRGNRLNRNFIISRTPEPGKYDYSLFINGELIKKKTIFINSNGWLAKVRSQNRGKNRINLEEKEIINDGKLAIPDSIIKLYNIDKYSDDITFWYTNMTLSKIDSKDFHSEVKIRSVGNGNKYGNCRLLFITFNFENGFLYYCVGAPSCIINEHIMINLKMYDAKYYKWYQLGNTYENKWNNIVLETKNANELALTVNNSEPVIINDSINFGELTNIIIKGHDIEIDAIKLFNKENYLIFDEDFNR